MGLKHRVADLSHLIFNRARHRRAFEAAHQPGTAADFAGFAGRKYALLVTFRKDGSPVPTPIWFVLLDDGRLASRTAVRTAKVPRLRRDPRARLFPSDARGKPLGPGVEATGRIVDDPAECERIEAAMDRRYGRPRRLVEAVISDPDGVLYLEFTAG